MSDKLSLKAEPQCWQLGCSELLLYHLLKSVLLDVFFQDWYDHVKSFSEQHDYDGLVVLLSITAEHRPSDQQVAVFSNDADLLNQVQS